ncbi:phosphoporin PhoE, partial [Salmonella enterica subsp. arizonae]|nr:phosphoporin PhoE [Salmonella enterica]ECV6094750.1 phosphoporin PhoE [Salmonella enterica]EDX5492144.1 phosphoporin PhoE [Salmonella enterica subsp. arizonae]EFR5815614.1 phosphoporin PhoE [Salmonella enterica]
TSSKRTLDQITQDKYDNGDRAEAWTGDANNVYLAANYTRTYDMTYMGDTLGSFAHKTDNWEMVGQYQFDNGLRPSLAFLQSRANDVNGLGSLDLVKYIDVSSYYYFNKNMSAYVEYKINMLKDGNPSNSNTDNTVALGLVYEF